MTLTVDQVRVTAQKPWHLSLAKKETISASCSFHCNYRFSLKQHDLHFLSVAERIRMTQCFNPPTVRGAQGEKRDRLGLPISRKSFFHNLGNLARYFPRIIQPWYVQVGAPRSAWNWISISVDINVVQLIKIDHNYR